MTIDNVLKCPKCGAVLPATTEFWHKSTLYKSGLVECACKVCRNSARVARRHKKRQLAGSPVRQYNRGPNHYQAQTRVVTQPKVPFEDSCFQDEIRRNIAPNVSIYK